MITAGARVARDPIRRRRGDHASSARSCVTAQVPFPLLPPLPILISLPYFLSPLPPPNPPQLEAQPAGFRRRRGAGHVTSIPVSDADLKVGIHHRTRMRFDGSSRADMPDALDLLPNPARPGHGENLRTRCINTTASCCWLVELLQMPKAVARGTAGSGEKATFRLVALNHTCRLDANTRDPIGDGSWMASATS